MPRGLLSRLPCFDHLHWPRKSSDLRVQGSGSHHLHRPSNIFGSKKHLLLLGGRQGWRLGCLIFVFRGSMVLLRVIFAGKILRMGRMLIVLQRAKSTSLFPASSRRPRPRSSTRNVGEKSP